MHQVAKINSHICYSGNKGDNFCNRTSVFQMALQPSKFVSFKLSHRIFMIFHSSLLDCVVLFVGGERMGVSVQGGMRYEEEESEAEGSESEDSVSDDNPQQTHTGYVCIHSPPLPL